MRIFRDMEALPAFRRAVVTVGSFDGVHRGHRFLLDLLRRRARELDGESVVVTFDEHPRRVLGSDEGLLVLTPLAEKAALLEAAGVDSLVVLPFTAGVAGLSAEEFVRDFLVGRLGVCELVVGYNHRLGHDRKGDVEVLEFLGEKYGFGIFRAPRLDGEEKISSTTIREALSRGDRLSAERMLGRRIK
jgi:riboflavin kinase/FMN adenylyltransferase